MKQDDRFFTIAGCCALLVTVGAFFWFNQGQIFQRRLAAWPQPQPEISSSVRDAGTESVNSGDLSVRFGSQPLPAIDAPHQVVEARYEPDPERAPQDVEPVCVDLVETVIETVAAGEAPNIECFEMPALSEVLVRRDDDGRMVVAGGTHRRYGPIVAAVSEVDSDRVAAFLAHLEQLGADEGAGGATLWDRLRDAADHLLEVEIPEVEPDMKAMGTHWGFADVEFERLSTAQKHMLLMGRDNARVLRRALVEIDSMLGEPDEEVLPAPDPIAPVELLVAEFDETVSTDAEMAAP